MQTPYCAILSTRDMTVALIDEVMARQSALADAISAQDVDRIIRATEMLAASVSELRATASKDFQAETCIERLQLAISQNRTDAVQLNLLRHWTRQRIDRLGELRAVRLA